MEARYLPGPMLAVVTGTVLVAGIEAAACSASAVFGAALEAASSREEPPAPQPDKAAPRASVQAVLRIMCIKTSPEDEEG
jgi:hypothetical protein